MPTLIQAPTVIQAAGNKPKIIQEFIGRVNSKTSALSLARMVSPAGWIEPGQKPEFDEYTLVLRGMLRVNSGGQTIDVRAGQAIIAHAGEWVQYATPEEGGAEYIAVCLPAFSPDTVHRDPSAAAPAIPPPLPAPVKYAQPNLGDDSDFCADCGKGIYYHGVSSIEIDGRYYCTTCAANH